MVRIAGQNGAMKLERDISAQIAAPSRAPSPRVDALSDLGQVFLIGAEGARSLSGLAPLDPFLDLLRSYGGARGVLILRLDGHDIRIIARSGATRGLGWIAAAQMAQRSETLTTVLGTEGPVHFLSLGKTDDARDAILWAGGDPARLAPLAAPLRHIWASRQRGLVETILNGTQAQTSTALSAANPHGLTRAESTVAALVADGLRAKAIAQKLGCSVPTVRTHLRNLYAKTGAEGLVELVRLLNTRPETCT